MGLLPIADTDLRRAAQNRSSQSPCHPLRLLGLLAMILGIIMISVFGVGMLTGYSQQQALNVKFAHQLASSPTPSTNYEFPPADEMRPVDGIDFAISVPKIGYSAAVREGVDQTVLYSGPGHYPTTHWPGQSGLVGIAAHNVYWIKFADLGIGDKVLIQTRYGTYSYTITDTKIVNPNDKSIITPSISGHKLVLTTCWPVWAGEFANQRYIITSVQDHPTTVGKNI